MDKQPSYDSTFKCTSLIASKKEGVFILYFEGTSVAFYSDLKVCLYYAFECKPYQENPSI